VKDVLSGAEQGKPQRPPLLLDPRLFVFQFALGPERARVRQRCRDSSGSASSSPVFSPSDGPSSSTQNDCWEGLVLSPGANRPSTWASSPATCSSWPWWRRCSSSSSPSSSLRFTGRTSALTLVLAWAPWLAAVGTLFGASPRSPPRERLPGAAPARGGAHPPGLGKRHAIRDARAAPRGGGGVAQAARRRRSRLPRGGRAHLRIVLEG